LTRKGALLRGNQEIENGEIHEISKLTQRGR
jgi:hypothetical protein